jgi:desulfoferrodoxin (superoxide reductase-like protein)
MRFIASLSLAFLLLTGCLKASLLSPSKEPPLGEVLGTTSAQLMPVGDSLAYGSAEISIHEGGVEFSLRVSAIPEEGRNAYIATLQTEDSQGNVESIQLGELEHRSGEEHFLTHTLVADSGKLRRHKLTLQVKRRRILRAEISEKTILSADIALPDLAQ